VKTLATFVKNMPSASYTIVAGSLEPIVGEILAQGIVKKGLEKVGADPESTTPEQMRKAIDTHIAQAVKTFMGTEKGTIWALKTKESLDRKIIEYASG
jgi:DNA integrity scanning protein DisA with diadenylate cyclase activity